MDFWNLLHKESHSISHITCGFTINFINICEKHSNKRHFRKHSNKDLCCTWYYCLLKSTFVFSNIPVLHINIHASTTKSYSQVCIVFNYNRTECIILLFIFICRNGLISQLVDPYQIQSKRTLHLGLLPAWCIQPQVRK